MGSNNITYMNSCRKDRPAVPLLHTLWVEQTVSGRSSPIDASVRRRGTGDVCSSTLDSLAVVLLSPATSATVQRSSRDTAGLLHASKLRRQPRSRRLRYKQTNLHSKPSLSRQPENRIKYPVILCCLRRETHRPHYNFKAGRRSDAPTITLRALPKDNNNNSSGDERRKGGYGREAERVRDMETNYSGWKKTKSRIWDIKPGLVEKKRKFKKTGIFLVCR